MSYTAGLGLFQSDSLLPGKAVSMNSLTKSSMTKSLSQIQLFMAHIHIGHELTGNRSPQPVRSSDFELSIPHNFHDPVLQADTHGLEKDPWVSPERSSPHLQVLGISTREWHD